MIGYRGGIAPDRVALRHMYLVLLSPYPKPVNDFDLLMKRR